MSIIATCPQCDTKFSVAAAILGADGKTVRCAKCKNTWLQKPDQPEGVVLEPEEKVVEEPAVEEEIVEEFEVDIPEAEEEAPAEETPEEPAAEEVTEDPVEEESVEERKTEEEDEGTEDATEDESTGVGFDDIPDSVKPVDGEDSVDVAAAKTGPLSKSSLIGYGAAIGVLLLIIVVTILLRPVIVNASLNANSYYGLFGFSPKIDGKTIAFNGVEAKIEDGIVNVSGNLLNLGKKEATVPYMVVHQLDDHNRVVKSAMIEPPVKSLKADAAHAFSVTFPASETAESVKISFTLKKPDGDHKDDHAETKSSPEQPHAPAGHHKPPAH